MKSNILFSVIIPTCNRNELLAKCLDCLAPKAQTLSEKEYEVIVSDDSSKTTAEEMMKKDYPWARWVQGPKKGPASNRNNGAKYAKGKWFAFTDDDCLPDKDWLKNFKKKINNSIYALEGSIHPIGNPNQDLVKCPVNLTGGYFWSANIAVKKELFEKIKGFDPNYLYPAHEDQDLRIRISEFTKIPFVSKAKIFHPVNKISFKKALKNIPKNYAAWAYHANKYKKKLRYKNNMYIILDDYKAHLKFLFRSIISFHLKGSFIQIIWLFIGIPLLWIELNKLDKKIKS